MKMKIERQRERRPIGSEDRNSREKSQPSSPVKASQASRIASRVKPVKHGIHSAFFGVKATSSPLAATSSYSHLKAPRAPVVQAPGRSAPTQGLSGSRATLRTSISAPSLWRPMKPEE